MAALLMDLVPIKPHRYVKRKNPKLIFRNVFVEHNLLSIIFVDLSLTLSLKTGAIRSSEISVDTTQPA
jgi:hypothetical protein